MNFPGNTGLKQLFRRSGDMICYNIKDAQTFYFSENRIVRE